MEQILRSLRSSRLFSSSSVSFQSGLGKHASTFWEKGWKGTSYWINCRGNTQLARSIHESKSDYYYYQSVGFSSFITYFANLFDIVARGIERVRIPLIDNNDDAFVSKLLNLPGLDSNFGDSTIGSDKKHVLAPRRVFNGAAVRPPVALQHPYHTTCRSGFLALILKEFGC